MVRTSTTCSTPWALSIATNFSIGWVEWPTVKRRGKLLSRTRSDFRGFLRRLPPLSSDPLLHVRHVGVKHRRQIQSDQLREHQSADHDQTEGLPRLAARTPADGDRYGPEQRGHGRHHDRAE